MQTNVNSPYLEHYGVKGMKWGVRKDDRRSGGNRRSSSSVKSSGKSRRGLSDKQKRALKVGAAVAVTALAAYGGYRMMQVNPQAINNGKKLVSQLTAQQERNMQTNFTARERKDFENHKLDKSRPSKITENMSMSLKRANPLKGTPEGKNNCTNAGIAGVLRATHGLNVTAKSTGGKQQSLGDIVRDSFDGARILEGSATKFGKSTADAGEMLKKRFGDDASGVASFTWKGGDRGHTISWRINGGNVSFDDFQQGTTGDSVAKYWKNIDQNGGMVIARLDNATPKFDKLKEHVDFH